MRLLLAALTASLIGCAAIFAPARPAWPPLPDGHFMHVGEFFQVTGTGRAEKHSLSETQEKSEARDAALLDAWTRLRAYLDAVPLAGGGTVFGASRNDPKLLKALERLAFSAQVVSTRWDGPTAAVVIRVEKQSINRLLGTDFR